VQGTLEDAVEEMAGARVVVRGASRTDAGVHALGQVVAFDPERTIPMEGWLRGLNTRLPPDVAVRETAPCRRNYQPRFDAVIKHYRYELVVGPAAHPLLRNHSWHVGPKLGLPNAERSHGREWLDREAMQDAASRLVGTHDFAAFRAADDGRQNTVRTLTEVTVTTGERDGFATLAIDVRGTAFLKQMVRIVVGSLVEVGRGAMTPDAIGALLEGSRDRRLAGPTAPACGLTLVHVEVGRDRSSSSG
jgi:tRNA pseudouridine38-40 synthase